ncbi:tetratricopeptide repeat-containing glycosyltransferase family protein [Bradyrhizobium sp. dw_78]|uniref:tetratricopeptide repeat-containing glycosyltransferase family protein n=1 Tax=Bradyrhizobium sp. dw_78 TaxID=2719793 RepID=UPI001BD68D33|nr:tetratricopeptide repeat-containing glycosyltransferase family protein [Bradyrhizobium sp. dw_78]
MQRQAYGSFHDGDLDKAERLCSGILQHRPDDFDALHLLGMLHFQRRRMVEALRFLAAALKANPDSSDTMSNLGLALHTVGRYEEAVLWYRHALQLAPDHPEILYNLGNSSLELGRLPEALSSYDAALAREPGHAGALVNKGNTLLRLNEPGEALSSYDAALAVMPGHSQILTNRGHALRRLGRPVEALADFRAALAAAPEFAEAHFEAAMTHLLLGDFDAGWQAYEWRWKTGAFAQRRRSFPAPLWQGGEPVSGKTVLLHAEQGFGDTIQFIRYAPLLALQGANVVCEVQAELQPLLSQFEGVKVIASGEPLPAFDLHCPLLSLPRAFKTQVGTIPAAVPYLVAPAERQARWRHRLPAGRPRAGFVWSGSSIHKSDSSRSIALSRLAALFEDPPLQCFSLQTELRSADSEVLRDLPKLIHLGGEIGDFTDTAAIISLLDIVVSVDTAVAHLAGALGKPVVILLPYAADFRWMRDREDTPWYPAAKLLRQPAPGDWDSVIARLGDELRRLGQGGA